MNRTLTMICKDLNGSAPEYIQVIPAGFHTTSKGDFICDALSQQLVLSNYMTRHNDMVIDYEHQTLDNVQAPAAGWVKGRIGLESRGDAGIWARVDWTDKAREYIASREYRYVSPVFTVRKSDNRVVALVNVALTNQPNIDGMVPMVNKNSKRESGGDHQNKETSSMGKTATDLAQRAQAFINQEKAKGRDVSASEAVRMVNSKPAEFTAPPTPNHILPGDAPLGIDKNSPIGISRRARAYIAYMKRENNQHISPSEAVHFVQKTGWELPDPKNTEEKQP